jgi:seryl-tRNA synthetase
MIDLKDLRENPDKYRRGAQLKNVAVDIEGILRLDEVRLSAQREFEQFRAEQNEASKSIGKLKDPAEKQKAIAQMGELKGKVKDAEERSKAAEAALMPLLLQVPQPPDDDVPPGKDASENVVERKVGEPRKFDFKPKTHIELCKSLDIADFEAGVRLAG